MRDTITNILATYLGLRKQLMYTRTYTTKTNFSAIRLLAARCSSTLFLLIMLAFSVQAQSNLNDDGRVHTVFATGTYQDFLIPSNTTQTFVTFALTGADGGSGTPGGCDKVPGGSGAVITATFRIGDGAGEIPKGSRVRFIPGKAGGAITTSNAGYSYGAADGGGGTGLIVNKGGGWEILAVAGGGGGAFVGLNAFSVCRKDPGNSAQTGFNGGNGDNDGAGTPGTNGHGATSSNSDHSSGGGGAFSDALASDGDRFETSGREGRWAGGEPTTGRGGYGFGSGGSANYLDYRGGGGGGYSGGAGGGEKGSGGGGGSYVAEYALNVRKSVPERTTTDHDGKIQYVFSSFCEVKIEQVRGALTYACLDTEGSGSTATGGILTTDISIIGGCGQAAVLYYLYELIGSQSNIPVLRTFNDTGVFEDVPPGTWRVETQVVGGGVISIDSYDITLLEEDPTPTVAKCVDAVTIDLGSDGRGTLTVEDIEKGSTGKCGIQSLELTNVANPSANAYPSFSYDCGDLGYTPVFLKVTDNFGNTDFCATSVYIQDDIAPSWTGSGNVKATVVLDENGEASVSKDDIVDLDDFVDDCLSSDQLNFTFIGNNSFSCADIGENPSILSIEVSDEFENTVSYPLDVEVVENSTVFARCQNVTVQLDANGEATVSTAQIDDGSSLGCGTIPSLAIDVSTFDCEQVGNNTVTLTATAANTNSSTCTATVTVEDVTPPTAICNGGKPSDQSVFHTTGPLGARSFTKTGQSFTAGLTGALTTARVYLLASGTTVTIEIQEGAGSNGNIISSVESISTATDYQWQEITFLNPAQVTKGNKYTIVIHSYSQESKVVIKPNNPYLDGDWYDHNSVENSTDMLFETFVTTGTPLIFTLNNAGTASLSASVVDAGSNDACGIANLSLDRSTFNCADLGYQSVTLTATDLQGNQGSCTTQVKIEDDIAPTLNCVDPGIVVTLISGHETTSFAQYRTQIFQSANASDNCSLDKFEIIGSLTVGCEDIGIIERKVQVTDESGNTSECSFNLTVADPNNNCNTAPIASCQDITVYTGTSCEATITVDQLDGGSSDPDGDELIFSVEEEGPFTVGAHVLTLRVDDGSQSSTCTSTVTVEDNTTPTAVCQDVTIQLDENGIATITAAGIDNGSNDACGIANLSLDKAGFDCSNVGVNTVTLTATDVNTNSSSCTATVTVEDNTAPTAICQDVTIQLDDNGIATITATAIDNGSNDACGIANLSLDKASFDCTNVGNNTVTLIATDIHTNSSSCTATLTIEDNTAPTAICQDITIQLDENGLATITAADIDNGSNDACGIANLSLDKASFDCTNVGGNTVTLTATDIHTNSSSCTATITVEDNIAPVASCQDITIQLDDNGLASITATAVDNGSNDACGIANLSLDKASFDCTDVGGNTVTLTTTDIHTNSSSCSATITVEDNIAPVASCQDVTVQLDETGIASITTVAIDNGSNDACGIANLSLDKASFDCTNLGDNTVTLTATDNHSNSSSCTATVSIIDEIAPTLTCPQDLSVNTEQGECGAYVTLPKAAPADNCGIQSLQSRSRNIDEAGNPSGSWSAWDGDHSGFFELGAYEIQWRAQDASDNEVFCSFQLNIIDEEAPEVICKDITINFNGEESIAISSVSIFDEAASFDACGAVSFVSQSLAEASCADVGEALTVQVVGIDPNGNTSTCDAQVTVTGMPCAFEATDIDCPNGAGATYDPVAESYTLTANDCEGYPDGEFSTVMTTLCGNGEIIARIASLSGDGRAGVIMMESDDPGARFVSKIKDLTPRTRTEYRMTTGGDISNKRKNRTGVKWVKIVREGPKFKTYTSTNGSYWRKSHTIEYETFADCIKVGLITYSKNANEPVTAVFDNIKVIGDTPSAFEQIATDAASNLEGIDTQQIQTGGVEAGTELHVAPNPFATQTQIEFTLPKASDVTLEIYNLHGQRVQSLEDAQLDAGTHRYEWDGTSSKGASLPTGIYMLRLRADKRWITTKVSLVNR